MRGLLALSSAIECPPWSFSANPVISRQTCILVRSCWCMQHIQSALLLLVIATPAAAQLQSDCFLFFAGEAGALPVRVAQACPGDLSPTYLSGDLPSSHAALAFAEGLIATTAQTSGKPARVGPSTLDPALGLLKPFAPRMTSSFDIAPEGSGDFLLHGADTADATTGLYRWNVDTGSILPVYRDPLGLVRLAVAPDGRIAMWQWALFPHRLRILMIPAGSFDRGPNDAVPLVEIDTDLQSVAMAFAPDGSLLLAGGFPNLPGMPELIRIDSMSGAILETFSTHASFDSLATHDDGRIVGRAGRSIYRIETGSTQSELVYTAPVGTRMAGLAVLPSTGCGNSILENAEECDDGNLVAGDCCSPTCTFEASDTACQSPSACWTEAFCDAQANCLPVEAPRGDCTQFAGSGFAKLAIPADPTRAKLAIGLAGGLEAATIGNPEIDTVIALCLHDASRSVFATDLPTGPAFWRQKKGIRNYSNVDGAVAGVSKALIRPAVGDKPGKMHMTASGLNMPRPPLTPGGTLSDGVHLNVQIVGHTGDCVEMALDVRKDSGAVLAAKGHRQ